MSVDISKLKTGVKIKMIDGEIGTIRGSYMSTDGIILTVKTNPNSIADRNVPLDKIAEILE